MLALVWAAKYFRCYLYGKRFVARTDHSALSYMRKFADSNCRLLRWSLKLSELDFVVEHRPGPKIGHADALSRHEGAVTLANTLDRDRVFAANKTRMISVLSTTLAPFLESVSFFGTMRVSHISAILVASIT